MNELFYFLESHWTICVFFVAGIIAGVIIGSKVLRKYGSHALMMISLIYVCLMLPLILFLSSYGYYSVAMGLMMVSFGMRSARALVPRLD